MAVPAFAVPALLVGLPRLRSRRAPLQPRARAAGLDLGGVKLRHGHSIVEKSSHAGGARVRRFVALVFHLGPLRCPNQHSAPSGTAGLYASAQCGSECPWNPLITAATALRAPRPAPGGCSSAPRIPVPAP